MLSWSHRTSPPALTIIADVHGNALALEAVFNDIGRRGLAGIVNLGDNVNGPLEPARSYDFLRQIDAVHIRGNGDRMTAEGGTGCSKSGWFARERLDSEALAWLGALPTAHDDGSWLAVHGTPRSDSEYLLESVAKGGARLRPAEEVVKVAGSTQASLLLCGHSHLSRLISLSDGRLVLNPGSVGLPAYEADSPFPHRMESGSPHARYATAIWAADHWQFEFVCVPYDWEAAAAQAEKNGFPDWARALRTGYA